MPITLTQAASVVVGVLALLAALATAWFARRQTTAVLAANAPTVVGEVTGALNKTSGACTVRLTFQGNCHIKRAVVSASSGSGLLFVGASGENFASRNKVVLDDVTPGSPIRLPGSASDLNNIRLRITVRGEGFGRATRHVDLRNCTPCVGLGASALRDRSI